MTPTVTEDRVAALRSRAPGLTEDTALRALAAFLDTTSAVTDLDLAVRLAAPRLLPAALVHSGTVTLVLAGIREVPKWGHRALTAGMPDQQYAVTAPGAMALLALIDALAGGVPA